MNQISETPMISFVIPVLNGEKYMAGCLEAIRKEMAVDDEIIVVDNGSTDSTAAIVAKYPEVKLLTYPKATIGAVRNHGAAIAKGSLLAFIDCDCLVCPGWRRAAVAMLGEQGAAATGSECALPESPTWVERAWLAARPQQSMPVDYIGSANFVVRRTAFADVSGFDETLITDEDTDLGFRLRRAGYVIINEPAVRVIHLGNAKTLRKFYRRQKWHAIGGLSFTVGGRLDKPMAVHIMFMISWLCAFLLIPMSCCRPEITAAVLALLFWIPIGVSAYRCRRYGHYRYFGQLILLYVIFFLSRTDAAVSMILRRSSGRTMAA